MKQYMKPFHNPISESAPSPSTNQYHSIMSGTWQIIDVFFHSILRYDRISPIISHIFPNFLMCVPWLSNIVPWFSHCLQGGFPSSHVWWHRPDRWVTSVLDQLLDRFLLLWCPEGFLKLEDPQQPWLFQYYQCYVMVHDFDVLGVPSILRNLRS